MHSYVMQKWVCHRYIAIVLLTEMTTEMFNKLYALVFFLLPEFQMTIHTGRNDEIRPEPVIF